MYTMDINIRYMVYGPSFVVRLVQKDSQNKSTNLADGRRQTLLAEPRKSSKMF